MEFLVADIDGAEARRVAEALKARHHKVNILTDPAQLAASVAIRVPDVVVAEASFLSGRHGVSPAALRAMRPDDYVYVIAIASRFDGPQVDGLYRAGVDDLLRRGSSREEIIGRGEAPARVRTWSTRLGALSCDFTAQYDLDRLKAWRELEALAAGEFGELLSCDLVSVDTATLGPLVYTAEIVVSFPGERFEIRFAVGVDALSSSALALQLFGGPVGTDVMEDAVREMANTLAGAFKRTALAEGALFTVGLPVNRAPFSPAASGQRSWVLESRDGNRIAIMALRVAQDPKRVYARDLRQGMVLVQDVRNAAGLTLLTAGTALTERTVERLIALVGPTTLLEIGQPGTTASPNRAN